MPMYIFSLNVPVRFILIRNQSNTKVYQYLFSTQAAKNFKTQIFRQGRKPNRGMVKSKQHFAITNDPMGRMLQAELKYSDTTIAYGLANNSGTWTKFTQPPQGNTSIQRIGDRMHIVRHEFMMYFTLGSTNDFVRVIILQSKGIFTSPPAVTDLLVSVSPASLYVYNARESYEILYDNFFVLNTTGVSNLVKRKVIMPIIPEQKFISGSTNVYNGQTYMLVICSDNSNVNYLANIRTWFEDSN
jgi:hypothetical protein